MDIIKPLNEGVGIDKCGGCVYFGVPQAQQCAILYLLTGPVLRVCD